MDMWNAPVVQSTTFHIQVNVKRGPGRPKMTLKKLTERDCRERKLLALMIDIPGDLGPVVQS